LYYDSVDRDRALALAQQQGYLDQYEVRFKRKDGTPYDTLLTLRPIQIKGQRCWQAVVEDITERKRAENAMRQSQEDLELRVATRTAELSQANAELKQQILERQQAETALRQKTVELQAVFEAIPDLFFRVDAESTILQYYAGAKSDLYVAPEFFLGKRMRDVLPPPAANQLHDAILEVHRKRLPVTLEYSLPMAEGEQIYEARLWRFMDSEVIVMVRNITERQRMEKALRHSEEQYRVLYEDNPSMYFTVDAAGKVLSVNRFGAEQLGYTVGELVGQPVLQIFYEDDKSAAQQNFSACLQNPKRTFQWEFRKIHKDGRILWVKETARAVQDADGKTIALIVCEDITETKQLRQKAERMERLAALGQLSTTIAHEIRNPLGSISLNFQYLSSHLAIPEAQQKTLRSIQQGISRIQNIIRGILDFARPAPLALKMANLHKVLDSSLLSTRHELEQAGIRIEKEYQAASPVLMLDVNLMVQVFINLFLNAKEAMVSGGQLTIRTSSRENALEVQIEDTGMGIPRENFDKIYNPFFTTKTDGIGLGLAVVFRILEQHQAQIQVESQVGKGTKFTIVLPSNQPQD
jgi:PAS domain S-box-containing protein